MVSIKVNKKALVDAAKENKPEKGNVTFRLSKQLYASFEKQCKKEGVKPTAVLEAFLKEFTKP